jgi:hypothetical protein
LVIGLQHEYKSEVSLLKFEKKGKDFLKSYHHYLTITFASETAVMLPLIRIANKKYATGQVNKNRGKMDIFRRGNVSNPGFARRNNAAYRIRVVNNGVEAHHGSPTANG